ncbi:MAG: IS1595 family transposase [Bradyrhizobiaceae bacterium]|nr:IS1595 family transposase [Bradyrhizobiaceae bacterium]
MTALNAAHFQTPEKARAYLEAMRWPEGPVCPHCGTVGSAYARKKAGLYRCAEKECRKDFTVTTKTVMESSHIKLHHWLQAFYLMASSKKGMSAHQLHRTLGITYKSAWFMAHRIREAMRTGGLTPLGGEGKIVEADETYFGKAETPRVSPQRKGRPYTKRGHLWNNRPIVALVERGGSVRSFHVPVADKATVQRIVAENISRESRLHTDESPLYRGTASFFAKHETVRHSRKEYVRDDIHTNSAEGYFSIFKRGMRGIYQHCKEKHLHRYLAEYDFRYNHREKLGYNDGDRAAIAVKGIEGKRLTYRQPH